MALIELSLNSFSWRVFVFHIHSGPVIALLILLHFRQTIIFTELLRQKHMCFFLSRSTAPNVDFSDLLANDCVHLDRRLKTWEEARANCISLGGDLFVAGDYEGAREYIKKDSESGRLSRWPWVGVRGKSWLDGHQVTDDEWDGDSTDINDVSCSYLHWEGLKGTSACRIQFTSLCVKGSYYW
ncbi:hypothetical protein Pmani_002495 [Petrolisthes manimaculis]|uniref:C-type lectin domain-containing protein n=1 Tax=Petrolisthes manimaculis TaxID=1843537 RepID=A0AAE1UQZ5_9EUCA|nr:hypothetical protein Pmani_002495 [Petrolisthes manimaculis]